MALSADKVEETSYVARFGATTPNSSIISHFGSICVTHFGSLHGTASDPTSGQLCGLILSSQAESQRWFSTQCQVNPFNACHPLREVVKMSSPNYLDYLVRQEQYKHLLREATQQRMVKIFGHPRGRFVTWSGARATKWSSTLKSDVLAASARIA